MESESLLATDKQGTVTILSFRQAVALDASVIERLEKEFSTLIGTGEHRRLILDFSSLQMISSRSLGVLLNIRKLLDDTGGVMVIAGVDPKLYRVFKITHLDSLFEFHPDVETALTGMNRSDDPGESS